MLITKNGLPVHPIGLGTNAIGGHNIYSNIDETVSKEIVRTFFQQGGNFVDTAYYYGWGRSEELIGEVMKEFDRESIFIATKGAHIRTEDSWYLDNSPEFLVSCVEDSLKRLQTDYLDLFYIHFPDETTDKSKAVSALQQLKKQGKIRMIGVSNFSMEQLEEANAEGYVDVVQGHYNLFNRDFEGEYTQYMLEHQIDFIPYFPLASGLLTGKYRLDSVLTEKQKQRPLFSEANFSENLKKIDVLHQLANQSSVTVGQIVLAYYLTLPFVSALIPGAKQPHQVISNLQAAEVKLTQADESLIEKTFTANVSS